MILKTLPKNPEDLRQKAIHLNKVTALISQQTINNISLFIPCKTQNSN